MTEKFIIVDTNAIINLFAGAGEESWDQLLNVGGGTKVIVLEASVGWVKPKSFSGNQSTMVRMS